MRGTTDAGQILVGHIVYLMEVFRADEVLVGNDTLDSRQDELITDARLEFLQMTLQVG